MQTWKDHISPDEHYTVLSEYDNGSAVCLSGYTGGASPLGEWGGVTLMKIEADGTTTFRNFEAVQTDWTRSGLRAES